MMDRCQRTESVQGAELKPRSSYKCFISTCAAETVGTVSHLFIEPRDERLYVVDNGHYSVCGLQTALSRGKVRNLATMYGRREQVGDFCAVCECGT
jgi:hypothetical protein